MRIKNLQTKKDQHSWTPCLETQVKHTLSWMMQCCRGLRAHEGLPTRHKQLLCNDLKIRSGKNGFVLIKINCCCVLILRETWIQFPLFLSALPTQLSTSLFVLCECRLLSRLPVPLSTSSPSAFQDQNNASRVKSFFRARAVRVCVWEGGGLLDFMLSCLRVTLNQSREKNRSSTSWMHQWFVCILSNTSLTRVTKVATDAEILVMKMWSLDLLKITRFLGGKIVKFPFSSL